MMIFMLIWGVIVSTSDNILRPILVSRYAPVSAFMVFVGVVGGIGAFGAIGIVVGPVFLALVAAILDYFDEKVIAPNKRKLDAQANSRTTAADTGAIGDAAGILAPTKGHARGMIGQIVSRGRAANRPFRARKRRRTAV